MRPNNLLLNPDVGLPAWLLALQQAIGDPDLRPSGEHLMPLAALAELISLSLSPPDSPDDSRSLQVDLGHALDGLGADLMGAVCVAVDEFRRNTLGGLPPLLATREGAEVAGTAAKTVSERLCGDEAVAAAWRDCVIAFRAGGAYSLCALRVGVLREIVEHRGHAWTGQSELIARVINDSAEHVARIGGDVPPPGSARRYDVEDRAQLGVDERLALIEGYLRRAAGDEQLVVWLLIYDAFIGEGVIDVGPVRFVDAKHLREHVVADRPELARFGLPAEMEQYYAAQLLEDLDDDQRAVLARVQTTTRAGEALHWARRTVTALLDIAMLDRSADGWSLGDGYMLIGARAWAHRSFSPPGSGWFDMGLRLSAKRWSRPDLWLAGIDPALVDAWADGREDAVNAIELARWERALAASPDDVFRVALGVRNLERTLPAQRLARGTGQKAHWTEVVTYYLKDLWVWHTLVEEMRELQLHAVSPAHGGIPRPGNPHYAAISTFFAALKQIVGTELPALSQMVEHAGALRDLMPDGSSRHRLLAALAVDTADPEATLAYLGRCERRFDIVLARAARQRNAAVHGSATVPAVIANVLRFSSSLGHRLVQEALAAAAAGESLLARLERERLIARERRAALAAGRTLSEVLRDVE